MKDFTLLKVEEQKHNLLFSEVLEIIQGGNGKKEREENEKGKGESQYVIMAKSNFIQLQVFKNRPSCRTLTLLFFIQQSIDM